jgi:hypothetical protein
MRAGLFVFRICRAERKETTMLYTVLVLLLFLALIAAIPAWPYSAGWGYYPSGGLGLILLIVIILLLAGRI